MIKEETIIVDPISNAYKPRSYFKKSTCVEKNRIIVEENIDFKGLCDKIKQHVGLEGAFTLYYKDPEGDLIRLDSEKEFLESKSLRNSRLILLLRSEGTSEQHLKIIFKNQIKEHKHRECSRKDFHFKDHNKEEFKELHKTKEEIQIAKNQLKEARQKFITLRMKFCNQLKEKRNTNRKDENKINSKCKDKNLTARSKDKNLLRYTAIQTNAENMNCKTKNAFRGSHFLERKADQIQSFYSLLPMLHEMGFTNDEKNLLVLQRTNGDLNTVVNRLLNIHAHKF